MLFANHDLLKFHCIYFFYLKTTIYKLKINVIYLLEERHISPEKVALLILDTISFRLYLLKIIFLPILNSFGMQTLGISNSKNMTISGLTSLNSQMFHIVINGCENVMLQGVTILASENSPNTDGVHVQLSTRVTILNSKISTGDDCISIGPGATNLWIEGIGCGPGHGIR